MKRHFIWTAAIICALFLFLTDCNNTEYETVPYDSDIDVFNSSGVNLHAFPKDGVWTELS